MIVFIVHVGNEVQYNQEIYLHNFEVEISLTFNCRQGEAKGLVNKAWLLMLQYLVNYCNKVLWKKPICFFFLFLKKSFYNFSSSNFISFHHARLVFLIVCMKICRLCFEQLDMTFNKNQLATDCKHKRHVWVISWQHNYGEIAIFAVSCDNVKVFKVDWLNIVYCIEYSILVSKP